MFYDKYQKITKEKNSIININLDPALPKQRKENVIPKKYSSKEDGEALLNFSLDIIEQVSDYCCSIKPNTQYLSWAHRHPENISRQNSQRRNVGNSRPQAK